MWPATQPVSRKPIHPPDQSFTLPLRATALRSAEDGLAAVQIAQAAAESARTGEATAWG